MLRRLLHQFFAPPDPSPADLRPAASAGLDQIRELIARKQFTRAMELVEGRLAQCPEDVDLLGVHAEILRRQKRTVEAKAVYRRALLAEPERASLWLDLGTCHYLEGDYFWARLYYRHACTLEPDNADVWNELGLVEILLGNYEKAEDSLEKAVNIDPEHAEGWNNLGLIAARRGARQKARSHFLRATFVRPDYALAFANLGLACRELELFDEAQDALKRAIDLQPGNAAALLNLATVLQDRGELNEAHGTVERARALAPNDPDVLAALSNVNLRLGDIRSAEAAAKEALAQAPQHAEGRLALAHVRLSEADFAAGWENYEARLQTTGAPLRHTAFPQWQGERLDGRSIYIYGEQGLGDEIMFASCLPEIVAGNVQCYLDCSPRLRTLFSRSFPRANIITDARAVQPVDSSNPLGIEFSSPIGSLPRFLRSDAADFPGTPYLSADPAKVERWARALLDLGGGLKVGVAWRGGLARTGQRERSLDLKELSPLLCIPDTRWISLQHRPQAGEMEQCSSLVHWPDALSDLDETAALLASLDLIVTVCCTLVHLGGALGRPVWVLTPRAPAWRYLLQGDTMPWYRSVRLYRQRDADDWQEPLAAIAHALKALRR